MQCVQYGKFHSCDTAEVAGHVHFGVHQVKWAFEEIPGHHEHGGLPPVMTDFNGWQGDIDQSDDGEQDDPEPYVRKSNQRRVMKSRCRGLELLS